MTRDGTTRPRRWLTTLATVVASGAAIAVAVYVVARPRGMRQFPKSSLADIAQVTVKIYANEAYPQFRVAHPDRTCPTDVRELNAWMHSNAWKDPWGTPYVMTCDATTFRVGSAGEDTALGTADDVWSDTP